MKSKNLAVRVLGGIRERFRFKLMGYVIMPDHVHLLISEPSGSTPAKAMQVFKQRVSRLLRGKRRRNKSQLAFPFPGENPLPRRFWKRRYFDMNLYSAYRIRQEARLHTRQSCQRKTGKAPQGLALEQLGRPRGTRCDVAD